MPASAAPPLVTADVIAKALGLSERTVRKLALAGKIPCKRYSHKIVRFVLADVLAAGERSRKK